MRTLLSLLFALLLALPSKAAGDTGLWNLYLAYRNATETQAAGGKVYALLNGNLLLYDTADNSTRTFDKLDGLSDKGISHIAWSPSLKCLVLLYTNNNIDLLHEDGTVENFADVYKFADYDIAVSKMAVNGDWLTLCTGEGVVLADLRSRTVKGYYRVGSSVGAAVAAGGKVYMQTQGTIYMGDPRDNLYDLSAWRKIATEVESTQMLPFGKGVYLLVAMTGPAFPAGTGIVYMELDAEGSPVFTRASDMVCQSGSAANGRATFYGNAHTVVTTADKPKEEALRIPTDGTVYGVTYAGGTYWLAMGEKGVCGFRPESGGTETKWGAKCATIGGFGTYADLCDKMNWRGGRLLVTGGDTTTPLAMAYENGVWTNFPTTGLTLNDGAWFLGVTDILQDPADASHHYLATWTGVMEYKGFRFVKHYNHSNSSLQVINEPAVWQLPDPFNYVRTYALAMDAQRNLFVANGRVDTVLNVMKPDGTWKRLFVDGMKMEYFPDRLLFDSKGRLWITVETSAGGYPGGMACLDYNGTADNQTDDKSLFRKTANNEDGTPCELDGVKGICFDRNGQLWIGCTKGVYAITDPDAWFSSDFTIYQPKIPRNDGTNYADYLLAEATVSAVAVDGGNRKWLGTTGSGLYLVNADGSEVLLHFTAEDSPLLSNNINDLCFNENTGELFISTDRGLCSYNTGVTPAAERLEKDNVKVSPNPVRPEHGGRVVISGLTANAEVKIVSAAGQLVYRGVSTGGSLVWNVRTPAGDRVATGVYYIYVSTADGAKSVAGKIAVI